MKLKNLLFLIIITGFSTSLLAQKTYRQTFSDPSEVQTGYLGLHYFGVDAGFGNTSGASLLSVGAETLYPITDKLRAEGLGLVSLFSLEKSGFPFLLNAGAEYTLSSNTKSTTVPVLLAFSYERDYLEGKDINTYTTVKLPGDITSELNLRGGLYLRNSALEYEENFTYYDLTNIFHKGIYAGVGYTRKLYMHILDSDGYEFAYARNFRPFADILVLPTSVDVTSNGNTQTLKETIGWRAGMTWQLNPITKAQNFDKNIGFFGNLLYRIEFGQRPLEGFFVTTSLAWTIKKFK
jgi:hypothetical protein